jgi:pimeloyl-ACP methyl ester carboxylesterase
MNEPGQIAAEPAVMRDGLAIYSTGQGEPLLLMPYPHGFGLAPIGQGPLAAALRELNQRVVAFDPPGAFNTTRRPDMSMDEMLACAEETLPALDIRGPINLVGHSMGGLCAIAFALAHPERVKKLVLIGTLSGGSAIQRHKGMPWGRWLTGLDRWRYTAWGMWMSWGPGGSLALHKKMLRLIVKASYADKSLVPAVEIASGDYHRPAPPRDRWPRTVFMQRLDYRARLDEIRAPTLVCVGRYDPQAPVACSEELAVGIPCARLTIFEHSGHYPFVEESERFKAVLQEFV